MKRQTRTIRDYLEDILRYVEKVQNFVAIVWKTAREDIPPLRKRCFAFSTPLGAISGCRLTAEA